MPPAMPSAVHRPPMPRDAFYPSRFGASRYIPNDRPRSTLFSRIAALPPIRSSATFFNFPSSSDPLLGSQIPKYSNYFVYSCKSDGSEYCTVLFCAHPTQCNVSCPTFLRSTTYFRKRHNAPQPAPNYSCAPKRSRVLAVQPGNIWWYTWCPECFESTRLRNWDRFRS